MAPVSAVSTASTVLGFMEKKNFSVAPKQLIDALGVAVEGTIDRGISSCHVILIRAS